MSKSKWGFIRFLKNFYALGIEPRAIDWEKIYAARPEPSIKINWLEYAKRLEAWMKENPDKGLL